LLLTWRGWGGLVGSPGVERGLRCRWCVVWGKRTRGRSRLRCVLCVVVVVVAAADVAILAKSEKKKESLTRR
jgi:hypothetical protein